MNFGYSRIPFSYGGKKKKKKNLNQTGEPPLALAAAKIDVMTLPLELPRTPKVKAPIAAFLAIKTKWNSRWAGCLLSCSNVCRSKGDNSTLWVVAALPFCYEFTKFRATLQRKLQAKARQKRRESITMHTSKIKGAREACCLSAAAVYRFQLPPGKKWR